LSPLNKGIYPTKDQRRNATSAPGCPEFGNSSVVSRTQYLDGCTDFSVHPGLHRIDRSPYEVVWWDPSKLRLDVTANFGLRQEEILTEDPEGVRVKKSLDEYLKWQNHREERIQRGSLEKFQVTTVTEIAKVESAPIQPDIRYEEITRAVRKSKGERFGTLVHTILRDIELDAPESKVENLSQMHGRLLAASKAEIHDAVDSVMGTLEHDLLKRARSADECHREIPLIIRLGEKRLVEGSIDLAFRESSQWNILDYKTDSELGFKKVVYENQVSWYAFGLKQCFDTTTIKGWLLRV